MGTKSAISNIAIELPHPDPPAHLPISTPNPQNQRLGDCMQREWWGARNGGEGGEGGYGQAKCSQGATRAHLAGCWWGRCRR